VIDLTATVGVGRLHRVGFGYDDYVVGAPHPRDGSILTTISGGFQLEHANGAVDVFQKSFTDGGGHVFYFLTAQKDPACSTITYNYAAGSGVQLNSVVDPDGRATTLYYTNAIYPNQITSVVDPFNRTNILIYNESGILTNTTDVQGLSSSFAYTDGTDPNFLTALTTPYGATSFTYGGVEEYSGDLVATGNQVNRFVQVTLPTGGSHLYLYRADCSGFMSGLDSAPDVSSVGSSIDQTDLAGRNSFHWNPLQYAHLTTSDPTALTNSDYAIGRLRHWLLDTNINQASQVPSRERAPSPDGSTQGQITWFDYDGKGAANQLGTNWLPSCVALLLPDGGSRFSHFSWDNHGHFTEEISTYTKSDGSAGLRTNAYYYAANHIDLVQQVGPNSEQVVSNYFGNSNHQPDASYDALNQETLFKYNLNRQLTSLTRPGGLIATNAYFTSGAYSNWLSAKFEYSGSEFYRSNAFTYANGLVATKTDERGLTTTNYWDNLQRLVGTANSNGSISNIYANLDLAATRDRLGNWSYFGYNSIRQKIAETNANGVVTRYDFCECGSLVAQTNAWNTPAKLVTTFAYDFQGNRTYTYLPDAIVTNWFSPLRQLTQTGDGWGYRYFYYNNQGLLTNTSTTMGLEKSTVFDKEDRPLWVTDANDVTVTNSFDVLGRRLATTYPDTGIESFGYSALGLIAYTNQIGASNFFTYNVAGWKTFETNANHEILQYAYNRSGDLTNLVDGKGQSTRFGWDEFGRTTNKIDQAGVEILRYTYDAADRLVSRWSKAKGTTYYTNDPVGNLTYINYPGSPAVSYAYDPLDRLTNMVDAVGTTMYSYTNSLLRAEDGPFDSDTVTNCYVNRMRTALALQQPTGLWTNGFQYDAARRLTNLTSQAGSFGYILGGTVSGSPLVKKLVLPNASAITNTFDSVGRLLGTYLGTSNGTLTNKHEYAYNLAGQRTSTTRMDGSTVGFTYDKIGQLTVADSSVNTEDRGYTYDSAWNLSWRTNNGTLETFAVDSKNQLTSAPSPAGAATYDDNGNLIATGTRLFAYDDENQLTDLIVTNGLNDSTMTVFTYDGLRRLRLRQEYVWSNVQEGPQFGDRYVQPDSLGPLWDWYLTAEVQYIYDGNRVIEERDDYSGLAVSYTRGTDLSGSLEGAGGIGGLLARSTGSSGNWTSHTYYHADGNGNITYLLDSSQTMVASYRYDSFGNIISKSGSLADVNVYRFSSKEFHLASGMYYFLYRFYDPSLQRWINRDPIGIRGGLNLYGFVRNRPTFNFDLFGLRIIFPPGSPPEFIERVGAALARLQDSTTGSQLLDLTTEHDVLISPGDENYSGDHEMIIDLSFRNLPVDDDGKSYPDEIPEGDETTVLAITVGHELAHALFPENDDPENVVGFENPIRSDFGICPRETYHGKPIPFGPDDHPF
jgi:RHS repeat-associated protein